MTEYLPNRLPMHGAPLEPQDAALLGADAVAQVRAILSLRDAQPTPLLALRGLARRLGLQSIHVKDEGQRLGIGSFKALGGAYALMVLVREAAERRLGRAVPVAELLSAPVRAVASTMTFACATDGNHGRSVAQGAALMGARAKIFVHSGVSAARIAAIARFGAEMIRVEGTYDASVAEAARQAEAQGWTLLSDTSWPGYERIPALVAQGYTVLVQEALAKLDLPPTHVFLQAGVGGFASAIAGHLALELGARRPHVTVVEPARAACLLASARLGRVVKVAETEPTVMAMLECYEPSLVAFRILQRVADGYMTVDEAAAPTAMRVLARPEPGDPPIVAGESGAVSLAGAMEVLQDPDLARRIGLGPQARLLVINTEGATDPDLYRSLVGLDPAEVAKGQG